jgi:hypothetical protein
MKVFVLGFFFILKRFSNYKIFLVHLHSQILSVISESDMTGCVCMYVCYRMEYNAQYFELYRRSIGKFISTSVSVRLSLLRLTVQGVYKDACIGHTAITLVRVNTPQLD